MAPRRPPAPVVESSPDSDAKTRLVAAVEEAIAALADTPLAFDLEDLDDQLATYGILQDLLNSVKDAMSVVGSAAIVTAPDRFAEYPVPGGGVFKIGGGKERKRYDQPRIISAAAAALRTSHDIAAVVDSNGETKPAEAVVDRIVLEVATLTGATAPSFSSWRSGAAKGLGLRLNDYAELEDAPLTHRIEGRSRLSD